MAASAASASPQLLGTRNRSGPRSVVPARKGHALRATVRLGRVRGIQIGVHWSLLVISVLSPARSRPASSPTSSPTRAAPTGPRPCSPPPCSSRSILAHELAHALVALRRGQRVEGITLWLLGGVASLHDEAPDPRSEFLVAIAGPAMSIALGVGLHRRGVRPRRDALRRQPAPRGRDLPRDRQPHPRRVQPVARRAPRRRPHPRPRRSGRGARTAARAEIAASRCGFVLGILLIGVGLLGFVFGYGFGDLWTALVGWFVIDASRSEELGARVARSLDGHTVAELMGPPPPSLPEWTTVADVPRRVRPRSSRRASCSPGSAARRARCCRPARCVVTDPAAAATLRLRELAITLDRSRRSRPRRSRATRWSTASRSSSSRRSDRRRRRPRRGPPRGRAPTRSSRECDHGAGDVLRAGRSKRLSYSDDLARRSTPVRARTLRAARRPRAGRSRFCVRPSVRCGWKRRSSGVEPERRQTRRDLAAPAPRGTRRPRPHPTHSTCARRTFGNAPAPPSRTEPAGTDSGASAAATASRSATSPRNCNVRCHCARVVRRTPGRVDAGRRAFDRVEHRLGRDDRDERARHRAQLTSCRGTARCPRDRPARSSGSRTRRTSASASAARAERDEALGLRIDRVADDEVEVHTVLRDLGLGHLLEHELRPVAVGRHDRPVAVAAGPVGLVAERGGVERDHPRRGRRSRR